MKTLNHEATQIFSRLIDGIEKLNSIRTFDNNVASLAVYVSKIEETNRGNIYAVSHMDLTEHGIKLDPEMTFLHTPAGEVIPLTYQNDHDEKFQFSMFRQDENTWRVRPKLQAAQIQFANEWLSNIKKQQKLETIKA